MLIYTYKGKKSVTSTIYQNSIKNVEALYRYKPNFYALFDTKSSSILDWERFHNKWIRDVYYSFTTLCKFNNLLVSDEYNKAITLSKNFLKSHDYIKDSVDNNCVNIYRYISNWLNELENDKVSNDIVKKGVVVVMKEFAKEEIFKISGCNLKSNYYDFV